MGKGGDRRKRGDGRLKNWEVHKGRHASNGNPKDHTNLQVGITAKKSEDMLAEEKRARQPKKEGSSYSRRFGNNEESSGRCHSMLSLFGGFTPSIENPVEELDKNTGNPYLRDFYGLEPKRQSLFSFRTAPPATKKYSWRELQELCYRTLIARATGTEGGGGMMRELKEGYKALSGKEIQALKTSFSRDKVYNQLASIMAGIECGIEGNDISEENMKPHLPEKLTLIAKTMYECNNSNKPLAEKYLRDSRKMYQELGTGVPESYSEVESLISPSMRDYSFFSRPAQTRTTEARNPYKIEERKPVFANSPPKRTETKESPAHREVKNPPFTYEQIEFESPDDSNAFILAAVQDLEKILDWARDQDGLRGLRQKTMEGLIKYASYSKDERMNFDSFIRNAKGDGKWMGNGYFLPSFERVAGLLRDVNYQPLAKKLYERIIGI